MKEIGRQLIHMIFGALILLIAALSGGEKTILFLAIILFLGLLLVQLKLQHFENSLFDMMIERFDRDERIPARGALAYVAGTLFLYSAMPLSFAMGITAILAFGDGFATLVGMSGRTKLPYNKKKSFEGLASFVLAGTASSMVFLGVESAFFYSLVLGIIESVELYLDDNIVIPFLASIMKTILR